MKISSISKHEFNNYASKHKYASYYQSSSYGNLMNEHNLKSMYLGFYENNELVGASLILHKPSFFGFKYGYAPRGLLIDYMNHNQVIEICKELKAYLFKEKFILLKIDPLITVYKKAKTGKTIKSNSDKQIIINTLKEAGFTHCGYSHNFESIKPRTIAELDLNSNEDELFKNLSKQIRNKIRKSSKLGLKVYKDNNALDKIYPFIARKGNYTLKYYQDFQKHFEDKFEIYVAQIDTEKYVESSRLLYEKELEYNEYLNNIISRDGYKGKNMKDILSKKMESDKIIVIYKEYLVNSITLLRNHPEGIVIAGAIIIKENDTIKLLIDGYDKEYKKLSPSYLLKWEIIKDYCKDYKRFNLNGISSAYEDESNKYKGLNNSKFGFNSIAREYIGEFNLIINNPIYVLYKSLVTEDSLKNINK